MIKIITLLLNIRKAKLIQKDIAGHHYLAYSTRKCDIIMFPHNNFEKVNTFYNLGP